MMQSVVIAEDAQIIQSLLALHRAGPRILDLTYGHGRFWAQVSNTVGTGIVTGIDVRHPRDLEIPRLPAEHRLQASSTALPFRPGCFDAAVCDPPFLIFSSSQGIMGKRFTSPRSYTALLNMMEVTAVETHTVLTPRGLVIIKTMDATDGRRRRWFHSDVQRLWESNGWRQDDLIVKIGVTNVRNPGWKYQARSKSAHTFFLVFRKATHNRSC
ncbi:MAG: class I SAM-dependent methyltransferase [Dehalococcoidia bacterium]